MLRCYKSNDFPYFALSLHDVAMHTLQMPYTSV
jgi:hypothetical protein